MVSHTYIFYVHLAIIVYKNTSGFTVEYEYQKSYARCVFHVFGRCNKQVGKFSMKLFKISTQEYLMFRKRGLRSQASCIFNIFSCRTKCIIYSRVRP